MKDLSQGGADKVLTKVLDEKSEEQALVRYDAARILALALQEQAPDKTADVLLEMLKNDSLIIYNRTDAKVEGADNEANRGKVNVAADTGGDARYMAAMALATSATRRRSDPKWLKPCKPRPRTKIQRLRRQPCTP